MCYKVQGHVLAMISVVMSNECLLPERLIETCPRCSLRRSAQAYICKAISLALQDMMLRFD